MANPQKENGYTPIANELVDTFCKLKLSPNEWQVLWCIIRNSYGWNKKTAKLTYSKIAESTGLTSPNIARAIRKLKQKKIIQGEGGKLSLQKDYEKWNYCLNRQYSAIRTDSKLLSKLTVATPFKPLTVNGLQERKDIYKDIKDISLSPLSKLTVATQLKRERLEEKIKHIFPECINIPKGISTEKLFLMVHRINKGEIKAENIKSPIAYMKGMVEEDIEPLLEAKRQNMERLRMEKMQRKRLLEEKEKEKEKDRKEIAFKIKEFMTQLNA